MSISEIVGLVLTVASLAAAVSVMATLVILMRRDRHAEVRLRRVDAYAQWLAGRKAVTRASLSFLAAFRALAAERRDSQYFSLRRDEAQRTRAAWSDSMRELDRAEAALLAWSADPSIHEKLAQLKRVSPEALHKAISGHQQDVDQLTRQLRAEDQDAAKLVRAATTTARGPGPRGPGTLARVTAYTQSIVDHWTKR